MMCDWFPCDREGPVLVESDPLGLAAYLCYEHAAELQRTFLLYRMGNAGRLAHPKPTPKEPAIQPVGLDMTLCQCGHAPTAHYLAPSFGGRAGCHACNAAGLKCPGFKLGYLAKLPEPLGSSESDEPDGPFDLNDFPSWQDE